MADSASPTGSSNYTVVTQDNKLSLTQQVSNLILHRQATDAQTVPTISGVMGLGFRPEGSTNLQFIGGNSTVIPGGSSTLYGSGGGSPMVPSASGSNNSISGGGSLTGNVHDLARFTVGGSGLPGGTPEPQTLTSGSTVMLSDNAQITYLDLRHMFQ